MKKEKNAERLDQNQANPGNSYSDPGGVDAQVQSEVAVDATEAPDNKPRVDSVEAIYRAKQRLEQSRRSRNDRPLSRLVKAESEIEERYQALQCLRSPKQKKPDQDLLAYQLTRSVDTSGINRTFAAKIKRDNLRLYSSLDSSDPIETILDRHLVALSNSAMECHARAAVTSNPQARDINLRHAEKMTTALTRVIEVRERRRCPKQVVVGNVNVEAGGQAIVGTVAAHKSRSRSDEEFK